MISKFKLKKKQKNKKKKGFTLIELLAVIVILAVIMVITIPTVIGSMNNAKLKAEEIFIASIEKSLNDFIEKELQYSDYTFEEPKNEYVVKDIENRYKISRVLKKEGESEIEITFDDFDELGYYPKDDLVNPRTEEKCDSNIKIEIYKNKSKNEYYYNTKLDCVDYEFNTVPLPEEPDLSGGLIPVVYDASKKNLSGWFVADPASDWYNYDNQEWANAVLVSSSPSKDYIKDNKFQVGEEILLKDWVAMFVWIPRFSYTIGHTNCSTNYNNNNDYNGNGMNVRSIDIKFKLNSQKDIEYENRPCYIYDDNKTNINNWFTPPAFTFDDKELSGFWVGKFEITGDSYSPTILPNKESFKKNKLIDLVNIGVGFKTKYSLTGDSHLIKNSEWAAITYLALSKYGKNGNDNFGGNNKHIYVNNSNLGFTGNSYGLYTSKKVGENNGACKYDTLGKNCDDDIQCGPCGPGASTTGTIYGVYDMVGGTDEFVMTSYSGNTGSSGLNSDWMNNNKKYYDYFGVQYYNKQLRGTEGLALFELNGYGSTSVSPNDSQSTSMPWALRGGNASSKNNYIFNYVASSGKDPSYENSYTSRIVYINGSQLK